jgi:hypothetical protein
MDLKLVYPIPIPINIVFRIKELSLELKKVVCLFFLSHWDLPNHTGPCCVVLLVPLESPQWVGTVCDLKGQELLNIEQQSCRKFNKINILK